MNESEPVTAADFAEVVRPLLGPNDEFGIADQDAVNLAWKRLRSVYERWEKGPTG